MGQLVLGTPVQQAAAQSEPQTGACRRTAVNQWHKSMKHLQVSDLDTCKFICITSHLKGRTAAWQPGWNRAHDRKEGRRWRCVTETCRKVELPVRDVGAKTHAGCTNADVRLCKKLTEGWRCHSADLLISSRPLLGSAAAGVLKQITGSCIRTPSGRGRICSPV